MHFVFLSLIAAFLVYSPASDMNITDMIGTLNITANSTSTDFNAVRAVHFK